MADNTGRYNFILTAQDRASSVFEAVNGKLNAFEMAAGAAESGLASFTSGLSGFGIVATSTIVTVSSLAAGLIHIANSTDEYEAHLEHLSQKLGVSTEFLSKMSVAGDINDISTEKMEKAIQRLSVTLGKAGLGEATAEVDGQTISINNATSAFDQLGISIKNQDGTVKSSEQIMLELAGAFGRITNSSEKAALGAQIFGAKNLDLLQILNQGRDALQGYFDDADRLGLVIGGDAAQKAVEYQENIKQLDLTFKGLSITLGNLVIPALNKTTSYLDGVMERLSEARKQGTFWRQLLSETDNTKDIFAPTAIDREWAQRDFKNMLAGEKLPHSEAKDTGAIPLSDVQKRDIFEANKIIHEMFNSTETDEAAKRIGALKIQAQDAAAKFKAAGQDAAPAWAAFRKAVATVRQEFDALREQDVQGIIDNLKRPEQELASSLDNTADNAVGAMQRALKEYEDNFVKNMEEKQRTLTFTYSEQTRMLSEFEEGKFAIMEKWENKISELQESEDEKREASIEKLTGMASKRLAQMKLENQLSDVSEDVAWMAHQGDANSSFWSEDNHLEKYEMLKKRRDELLYQDENFDEDWTGAAQPDAYTKTADAAAASAGKVIASAHRIKDDQEQNRYVIGYDGENIIWSDGTTSQPGNGNEQSAPPGAPAAGGRRGRGKGNVAPDINAPFGSMDFGASFESEFDSQFTAFASGGIVTRPTRALVGEAGPEAIIPLSKAGSIGHSFTHNGDIIIHAAPGMDADEMAAQVDGALAKRFRSNRSELKREMTGAY